MHIELDREALRHKKLFVGTPMYDGRCYSEYAFKLCQLTSLCTQLGIELEMYFLPSEALITLARNDIADKFLRSDASNLMFIDADIGFNPVDVVTLLAIQEGNQGKNDYDVLSAPYPFKRIAWDRVAKAVESGVTNEEPAALKHYAGEVLIAPLQKGPISTGEPVQASQAGTGFMMIRRATLEAFEQAFPHRRYKAQAASDPACTLTQFFDTETRGGAEAVLEELVDLLEQGTVLSADQVLSFINDKRADIGSIVSEDYMFCRRVRQIGMKVWTCPWMVLTHTGTHTFAARLEELARIGVT